MSSIKPTPQDLATPFGKLFSAVQEAVDPEKVGSVVQAMNRASRQLGFAVFTSEP